MRLWIKGIAAAFMAFFLTCGLSLDREDPLGLLWVQEVKLQRILDSLAPWMEEGEKRRLSYLVASEARRYGYDPELVLALILVESSFRIKAVSRKRALGLMQLRPPVAKALARELGILLGDTKDVFEPEVNINLGLFYLSKLHAEFGDLELALIAYNYGPTYLRDRMSKGLPLPKGYPHKVLTHYRRFSQAF